MRSDARDIPSGTRRDIARDRHRATETEIETQTETQRHRQIEE